LIDFTGTFTIAIIALTSAILVMMVSLKRYPNPEGEHMLKV